MKFGTCAQSFRETIDFFPFGDVNSAKTSPHPAISTEPAIPFTDWPETGIYVVNALLLMMKWESAPESKTQSPVPSLQLSLHMRKTPFLCEDK